MKSKLRISRPLIRPCLLALLAVGVCAASIGSSFASNSLLTTDPKPKKKKSGPQASTAAEGGGAHNGPVMSGAAIPVQNDRGITLAVLNKTILACFRGLENSIARSILGDYTGSDSYEATQEPIRWGKPDSASSAPTLHINGLSIWPSSGQHRVGIVGYLSQYSYSKSGAEASFQIAYDQSFGAGNVYGSIKVPAILIDDTFNEGAVDEFGRNLYDNIQVKNLRVIYPENTPDVVALINTSTSNPMSATANIRDYYNCILEGVQK
jgi:hypothetical protein